MSNNLKKISIVYGVLLLNGLSFGSFDEDGDYWYSETREPDGLSFDFFDGDGDYYPWETQESWFQETQEPKGLSSGSSGEDEVEQFLDQHESQPEKKQRNLYTARMKSRAKQLARRGWTSMAVMNRLKKEFVGTEFVQKTVKTWITGVGRRTKTAYTKEMRDYAKKLALNGLAQDIIVTGLEKKFSNTTFSSCTVAKWIVGKNRRGMTVYTYEMRNYVRDLILKGMRGRDIVTELMTKFPETTFNPRAVTTWISAIKRKEETVYTDEM